MKVIKKLTVFLLLVACAISFCGCTFLDISYTARERRHYLDKSNFVSVTAVCVSSDYYSYPSKTHYYAIDFKEAEYETTDGTRFQNVTFRVDQESTKILEEHDIQNKLTPGTIFTCISAPIYLTNSYDCPIVALEIDGEVLLDFDTGYKNLMETYGVRITDDYEYTEPDTNDEPSLLDKIAYDIWQGFLKDALDSYLEDMLADATAD